MADGISTATLNTCQDFTVGKVMSLLFTNGTSWPLPAIGRILQLGCDEEYGYYCTTDLMDYPFMFAHDIEKVFLNEHSPFETLDIQGGDRPWVVISTSSRLQNISSFNCRVTCDNNDDVS